MNRVHVNPNEFKLDNPFYYSRAPILPSIHNPTEVQIRFTFVGPQDDNIETIAKHVTK